MSKNTELKKVRENLDAWLQAFNAKDLDKLFSLYDPESMYANAGAPLMKGVAQIKPWYQEAFKAVKGTLLHIEEGAFQEGNMALLIGRYYFKPEDNTGNEEGPTGRVALAYRKSEDGRWLLLFDMDNVPPDVKPEDF